MDLPEGYIVPVYRSLSEPVLIAGAPRAVTILNGTLAASLGLGLQLWLLGLMYWFASQGIAVWMTKRDPQFFETATRHIKHKGFLSC